MTSGKGPAKGADNDVSALRSLHVPTGHGSSTDGVTDTLREAILGGIVSPGTWLREGELSTTLGVSRTPVREALRRLADEGLTHREVHRGSVVAPMSIEDILAVYTVRANLEGLAARLAAAHATTETVAAMRAIHDEMQRAAGAGERVATLNLELHRLIREAAHNAYLERFLVQVENSVRRFGQTTFNDPERLPVALEEHGQIIDAIADGDGDLAERLALAHMRNAREVRLRQLLAE